MTTPASPKCAGRSRRRSLIIAGWLCGIAALGLFYVLGPPPPRGAMLGVGFDKMLHGLVFTAAAIPGFLWVGYQRRVLLAGLTLAVGLEALQGFMPARQLSLRDVAANVASILVAWAVVRGGRAYAESRKTR